MNKKILIGIVIGVLLLGIIRFSYSFFTTSVIGTGQENTVTAGTLELKYIDGPGVSLPKAYPGQSITKIVSVSNTGTLDAEYGLIFKDLINEIEKDELVVSYTCNSYNDYIDNNNKGTVSGTCLGLSEQVVPYSKIAINSIIQENITIASGITHEYKLTITFKEINGTQNYNQGKYFSSKINILDSGNVPNKPITSSYNFGWTEGTINSDGEVGGGGQALNNYYTPVTYFDSLTINLLTDNVMFKIVEYDKNGNFISTSGWQSKTTTQWTTGGTTSISIEKKYVRIAIADTTLNNTSGYTLNASDYDSRYSYSIIIPSNQTNQAIQKSDLGWIQGTINSDGEVSGGGQALNNYYTPVTYFDSLTINLLTDNVMFKIVEYDKNGNFISTSGWQSKTTTQWTTGGTSTIIILNKYIRIAIADTTINNTSGYTLNASDYDSRYDIEVKGNTDLFDKYPSSIETIILPDVKYGGEGLGFTITGLTYSAIDNTYYAGNYGKIYTSDSVVNNTIVHLSSDLKTNLGEIELKNIYPDLSEVQGVTIDTSDDTIWIVSPPNHKMYHISKSGEALGTVSFGTDNLTGITYDSRTNTLWVLSENTLKNVEKNGTIITTINLNITNVDQLYLDETNDLMYITAGANYQGDNYVYTIKLSTQKTELKYTLKDSYAIEGIYIKDDKMYIGNDGLYHDAKIKSNIIQVYKVNK